MGSQSLAFPALLLKQRSRTPGEPPPLDSDSGKRALLRTVFHLPAILTASAAAFREADVWLLAAPFSTCRQPDAALGHAAEGFQHVKLSDPVFAVSATPQAPAPPERLRRELAVEQFSCYTPGSLTKILLLG